MIKILFLITALFFTGCVTKRGISIQHYNDCKEYYDLQGFYHKDCEKELFTYQEASKSIKNTTEDVINVITFSDEQKEQKKPTPNVW